MRESTLTVSRWTPTRKATVVLELARSRSRWIDKHHGGLSFALWFLTLAAVYIWVLPRLGLQPNWRVLAP